ncbi:MAG: hypothetical protein VX593_04645 [Pseudomonadota bacterium]|nr:hypothetical protein [Pseudomonadota bacterium]
MKLASSSRQALLASLGVLALAAAGCSQGQADDDDHGHAHENGEAHEHEGDDHARDGKDDHAHEGDDHGHERGDGAGEHQHAASTGEPTLGFSLTQMPAAGEPLTVSLILNGPDGQAVTADDMTATHGEKLHVIIVDEGLEDFIRLHPAPGADGNFDITFTPEYARTYRVWTRYALATGEDAHGHDHKDDHHHHDDEEDAAAGEVVLSDALIIGEEDAPDLAADALLTATEGDLQYALNLPGDIQAGQPVTLTVSVSEADGAPFEALEPLMDSFGHLVGFNQSATQMIHAHPTGAHPHGTNSRSGPDLQFETTFETPGPHRLFLQTRANG